MEVNLIFFGYLCISLIVSFLVFYIPGRVVSSGFFPKLAESIYLSLGVGLSLWALQGYFFAILGLRNLTWAYLIVSTYLFLRLKKKINFSFSSFKSNKVLFLIIVSGVLIQNLAVFPSGLKNSLGIRFYDINAFDGIYHLTLSKNLVTSFPAQEPGFWGHSLINYHYFSNLVIADVARLFQLPVSLLQFQVFPLLLSALLGLLAYEVGRQFAGNKNAGKIFAFLVYFGSDFGYITSLVLLNNFSITSLQPIETSSLLFTNPPRAFAEVVLLSGLLLLLSFLRERKLPQFLISSLVLISTLGFKVYFGIFSAVLVAAVAFFDFVKSKNPKFLFTLVFPVLIAFLIYFPTNSGARGLFFAPFSWPRHYFASGALQALQWHLAEQVFWQHQNFPHLAILYLQYTAIFLFTILGTRVLGLFAFNHYLIYIPTIIFLFLGIFFLQEVGIYNTFNFFSVAALTLSLLTADVITRRFQGKKLFLISVLLLLLTIPRPLIGAVGQAKSIGVGGYIITNEELAALNYLKENSPKSSVILVAPGDSLDYNSPYVECFSERATFLSNLDILESHNQPVNKRKEELKGLLSQAGKEKFFLMARQMGINYFYVKKDVQKSISYKFNENEIFFRNSEVVIIKTN